MLYILQNVKYVLNQYSVIFPYGYVLVREDLSVSVCVAGDLKNDGRHLSGRQ